MAENILFDGVYEITSYSEANGEFKLKVADDEEITFYLKGE